ncbi:MAG: hypothetical protein QOJ29_1063 [Thermoleophilaceae bacterium]|jgi:hypothetical protein|nr:hypothetical protein [Thermoleophilaceae bacterium]
MRYADMVPLGAGTSEAPPTGCGWRLRGGQGLRTLPAEVVCELDGDRGVKFAPAERELKVGRRLSGAPRRRR